MNEPKYVLAFDPNKGVLNSPYVIYEQAIISGRVAQRPHSMYGDLDTAMRSLSILNDNQPILLAYSTKTIDNVMDLSRD